MSGLHHLITMHKTTMSVYNGVPDDDWPDIADQVSATIEASRAEIVKYRPRSLDEMQQKAEFMLSCKSFTEWGDIDIKDLINGFTRGVAA
jgi:hypothetical protein